ncbi:response regulator transcription factor [Caballeronia grimmiae]|uniref:response regulator transcription factor n=1 Tax=Caballeronia grimmiae TaxID=1071679 RepID=UPI0038BC9367
MNREARHDRPSNGDAGPEIVGVLSVDEARYRIVVLHDGLVDNANRDPVPTCDRSPAAEMVRFRIDGKVCGIMPESPAQANAREGDTFTQILTHRELQIATLVALGRANKQIAAELHISEWTVSSHLRRIFSKLGVRSRAALAYRCASVIPKV